MEAAAQTYFDKHVQDLTIAECAMLAGLPKKPSSLSPKKNLEGSLERRAYVLKRMLEDGFITEAQYEEANQEEPKIVTQNNPYVKAAPDFVEHVRRYLEKKYGADVLYKEGLQVYTTVDLATDEGGPGSDGHGPARTGQATGISRPDKDFERQRGDGISRREDSH